MKDWKICFLKSSLLGQATDKSNPDEVFSKCFDLAYRDMMTAGRFYSSSFLNKKEDILKETKKIIRDKNYSSSRDIIEDVAKLICNEKIGSCTKYVTGFGLAQKLVNMTFKYLYVFSDLIFKGKGMPDFSKCDCPIDSIILKKAGINDCAWSKLTNEQYETCQEKISEFLKNEKFLDPELSNLGNLAYDFMNW